MIAEIIYGFVALVGYVFGITYLFRKQCMPYHLQALEREWSSVPNSTRVLCLALMRVAGGGYIALALSMTYFLYLGINQNIQGNIALFLIGMSGTVPSLIATIFVKRNTKGKPPVKLALITSLLVTLGFILSLFGI